jgi:hypothetical protein
VRDQEALGSTRLDRDGSLYSLHRNYPHHLFAARVATEADRRARCKRAAYNERRIRQRM